MVILQSPNISYLVSSTGLTQTVPGTIYTALAGKAFVACFYLSVCESTCIFIVPTAWWGVRLTPAVEAALFLIQLRATTFSLL